MYPFTLRQLEYAVAVADSGGFRRAAAQCHVSQPSLSAQVALLESALGVRLFERGRGGVLFTSAGQGLVARARRLLRDATDLHAASARLHDPLRGVLRIGVLPTVSPYLLPAVGPALHARFPALEVHWSEERTDALLASLREGSLDAAFLAQVPGMEGLAHAPVIDEPFVLAGAPGHALFQRKRPVRMDELRGQTLLLLEEGHCFREQALEICASARARDAGYRATSLATLARVAAGGNGLTLLPLLSLPVENRNRELATRAFARPVPSRALVLSFRAGSALAGPLQKLARVMSAACRQLAKPKTKLSTKARMAVL